MLVEVLDTSLAHTESSSNNNWNMSPAPNSTKRSSVRLAKKDAAHLGKDSMQITHDLLVKKLGDLSGEEPIQVNPDNDLYMQHFE